MWSKRRAQEFDDSDSDENDYFARKSDENDIANVTLPTEGHGDRLVLISVIAPYSHTYLAVANTLHILLDNCMLETDFLKLCVKEITNKVENFECKYGKWKF